MQFTTQEQTGNERQAIDLVKKSHDNEIVTVKGAMAAVRESTANNLKASGEIKVLSDEMDITKPQTIMQFGSGASTELATVANEIIQKTKATDNIETTKMINNLAKIMQEVDIDDFKEVKPNKGLIAKVFDSTQKKVERFIAKYDTVGKRIENIQVQLKKYEMGIEDTNRDLENMYENAMKSYGTLVKYVAAGDCAVDEVDTYIVVMQRTLDDMRAGLPNPATEAGYSIGQIEMQLNNAIQSKQLLVQRVHDLRMAENVALQSIPMIKALQNGNLQLYRKIELSLIVTVPVFQNAVAQAIVIKRMQLQSQALEELDKKTNEMLLKNSQNTAKMMQDFTEMSGKSAIEVSTIQQSWKDIMDGIEGTRRIQEELDRQREQDKLMLADIERKYVSKIIPAGIKQEALESSR